MIEKGWKAYFQFFSTMILSVFLLGVFSSCDGQQTEVKKKRETRISGQMLSADRGEPLAGVIAIEKGRLYGQDYKYGGKVDEEGRFSVKVAEGGDYALHLYATHYIYHPVGVVVKAGEDNQFTFKLPPNPALEDAPVISKVVFEPVPNNANHIKIKISVYDPNNNLSHQVLGVNILTQEGVIFSPPGFVSPGTQNYPNGIYTLTYDTQGKTYEPKEWIFVAADNRCYNSPVLKHPFTEEGIIQARASKKAKPAEPSELPSEKLDQKVLLELGQKIFLDNCAVCHYSEKTDKKIGPGLKELFKRSLTPTGNLTVTEENIRNQITKGSELMPPYSHITGQSLDALIAYLKSL